MKEVEEVKKKIVFESKAKYNESAVNGVINAVCQYTELFDSESLKIDQDSIMENSMLHIAAIENKDNKQVIEGTINDVYIPLDDNVKLPYTNKSVKQGYEDLSNRVMGYIDESLAKHTDPNSGMNRVATTYKNQLKLVTDPDYMDYIAEDPTYKDVASTVMTSLPAPNFKNLAGESEMDLEKYDQLINKFSFLSMLEERQKFMMEKTIPYVKAKKNGTLTPKMEARYKDDYMYMLEGQKKHCDDIKNALNHPDSYLIKSNKTLDHSDLFMIRWQVPAVEFADTYTTDKKLLENGWAPIDLSVINKVQVWHKGLKNDSVDKTRLSDERKMLKKQYDDVKPLIDRLNEEKKLSAKEKYEILNGINKKIKEYGSNNDKITFAGLDKAVKRNGRLYDATERRYFKKLDIKEAKEQIDKIYKSIKDVDFFMFGQGSDAFDNMLKAVKEAKEFADKTFPNGTVTTDKDVVEFMDKCTTAQVFTSTYIAHKDSQIVGNWGRKQSRQTREQPRISAAINGLEGLEAILGSGEAALTAVVKEKAQKKIQDRLVKEEEIRSNPKTTGAEYERSVIRSIAMVQKASDAYYKQGNQSFHDYFKRVVKAGNTSYPAPEVDKLYNKSVEIRNITKTVLPGVDNPVDENNNRIVVTNEEIKKAYQDAVVEKTAKISRDKDISMMRTLLLSDKQQAKDAAKKAQQNKAPKAPGK